MRAPHSREIVEAFLVAVMPGGYALLDHAAPSLARIREDLGDEALTALDADEQGTWKTGYRSAFHAWDTLNAYDELESQRRALSTMLWAPTGATVLPIKYREIIATAILAHRAYPTVPEHLERALQEGATIRECIEALMTAGHVGGMPILHHSWPYLIELEKKLEAGHLG